MADSMEQFLDIIDNRIEKHLNFNTSSYIKQRLAKVIEVDTDSQKVYVYFVDDENQTQYVYYNKTNEIITSGDNVKVFYTSDIIKGWIGERCGEPNIANIESATLDTSPLTEYQYLTDTSVKFNGTTYTIEKDADTGLISKISDGNGNEFEPTVNSGITDTALHNAVFWAVAMVRGISSPQFVMDGIFGMFTPGTRDIANSRWRNSISGYNDMTLTGGSVNENAVHFTASQYGTFICDEPNTVYAIVKSEQSEAINCVITKKLTVLDGSVNYGFNLLQYGGQMYFSAAKNDILQPEETALPNTEYHCYCYTRSGKTTKFYADGVFVGSMGSCNTGKYSGLMYLNNELFGSKIIDEPTVCDFVMCAFGSQYHDEATVRNNSAYLMKKYKIGGST